MAGEVAHGAGDLRRVGTRSVRPSLQSSSAASGSNGTPLDVDELGVVGLVRLGADVAEDLVAPRVPHRLGFARSPASSRSPTGE